jgi:hypothetical protein
MTHFDGPSVPLRAALSAHSLRVISRCISATVLIAFVTVGCPLSAARQAGGSAKNADATNKKPAPKKDKAAEPSTAEKLEISGYEPLFLQKKTDPQAIHLVGTFPKDVLLDGPSDALVPDPDRTWASDKEVFAWVTLAGDAKGTAFLLVKSSAGTASVSFEIRDACTAPGAAPAEATPTPVEGWNSLCNIPASPGKPDKKTKRVTVAYGINALQHSSITNPTPAFCKNSSASIDVVELKDTYLETNDVARVVVCNQNPFRWATTFSRDETAIKNDDPSTFLGILDPMLGASNATKTATNAADAATKNSPTGTTNKAAGSNRYRLPLPGATPPGPQSFTFEDPVQACVDIVATSIKEADDKITNFIAGYNSTKVVIEDDSTDCDTRRTTAINLWSDAQKLPIKGLNAITSQISSLKTEVAYRVNQFGTDGNSLGQKHVKALQDQGKALDQQLCVVGKLLTAAAKNIPDSVVTPIQNILGTNGSFVYVSTSVGQYHDPTDVTWKLSSTLKNTSGSGVLASSSTLAVSPYLECLSTTNDNSGTNQQTEQDQKTQPATPPVQPNTPPVKKEKKANPTPSANMLGAPVDLPNYLRTVSFVTADIDAEFQSSPPDPQGGHTSAQQSGQNNKPSPGKNQQPPGGAQQTDQAPVQPQKTGPTQEDGPQIHASFGAPEFVVSAGVAAVLLRNQQFQKVQASGQTSGTTIEYSTNSLVRMSPLIMAHARLYKYKGSDRAIWGTLGVTGASNNNGVSAEYFAGASWSWLHNWVFLSPGLYIGQRQSLTGGYKVGQQLPSSFTGSLPTTQNYKLGFGLALSIRIPGTSTPKAKSSDSSTGKGKNASTGGKTNSSN